jgi:cytochrome c biogenesis protein CcmG, thiol:disulfide interchange protein DsbE
MNQRVLGIISILAVVALIAGALFYVRFHPSHQLQNASVAPVNAALAIGDAAPQFSLPTTHGVFDLNAQSKPVFLEIFATWCPHCQRETKVLNALYRTYGSRVAFISIPGSDTGMDGTSPESQFDVLQFQIQFAVQYPIAAYDPQLAVANRYLHGGFPTLAVIDRKKTIAYINSGEVSEKDLSSEIEAVLK